MPNQMLSGVQMSLISVVGVNSNCRQNSTQLNCHDTAFSLLFSQVGSRGYSYTRWGLCTAAWRHIPNNIIAMDDNIC